MIKINNETIPTPSDFQCGIEDIDKAERNAKGELIKERIATKRKLEFTYKFLSQEDCAALLQKISGNFFTVEYPDSQTGALRTGTFYSGGRAAGAIDYRNSVIRWKDIKFNLIEK